MDKLKSHQLLGGYKDPTKIEFCTQVEERYYLQYETGRPNPSWANLLSPRGFKTLKSAISALNKARENQKGQRRLRVRIVKQTRTIEIKTTTEIEVLDDRSI